MTQTPTPDSVKDRPSSGAELASQITKAAASREKSKNFKALFRLWPYIMQQKTDFLLMVVFLLLSSTATFGITFVSKGLVDQGFGSKNPAVLNMWFIATACVALTLAIATACRYFYITKLGERVVANLRQNVFSHILSLDPGFFIKIRTGEVISRLTTDLQIIDSLVSSSISIALRNGLSFFGGLTILFFVSPKLTLMVMCIFPIVLIPLFVFGRQVGQLTRRSQDGFAEAVGHASETLDALETVQAFVREDYSASKFAHEVDQAYGLSLKRIRARAILTAMVITLVFGGVCLVLWIGAQAVMHHEMSQGTLTQFVLLSILVCGSVANLSETFGDLQKAAGAMIRIDELLSATPNIKAPPHPIGLPSPARGEVRFDQVSFAYPSRPDLPVLSNFSLGIAAGETIALVGPSGAGKSTVFKLLLRYYGLSSGHIYLDGVDIEQTDPKDLRTRLALVAQDQALFSGSAEDNIRFGREGAGLDDIRQAAEKAQALNFIEDLPQGFAHPLGERAKSLSGGQKQRLAIARALVRKAPILLLDEATSALDAENERLVQKALTEAMGTCTTLVIAHRLATVLKADRIIVMDQGQIVEQGTHSDLVAKGGLYARLAQLQFQQ